MDSKDQYIKNLEALLKEKDAHMAKLKEDVEGEIIELKSFFSVSKRSQADKRLSLPRPSTPPGTSRPKATTPQTRSRPTTPVLQNAEGSIEHIAFNKVKDFWASQQQSKS